MFCLGKTPTFLLDDVSGAPFTMISATHIPVARGSAEFSLLNKYGNRHGLIAGATGTGKTVSLQVLAEGFSARGVPVFMADVKGDLAGLSQASTMSDKLSNRLKLLGIEQYQATASPVVFWDIFGEKGHPLRSTISEMGPILLARVLELNDTQEGVLNVVFRVADEEGLLLLDLADLRAMLNFVSENAKSISAQYGLVSAQSIAAIQRTILSLEDAGGEAFFGEPAFELRDLFAIAPDGRGVVNVMAADQLILKPKLYSTFLLWLLSELFEQLPEVGDLDKPRMVFFFDEAHLLFTDASDALVQRVEQVVRLIRSKGVGIYFISQNPDDVPDAILGQLGNRIQHALRAFTPRDQKAVRVAAETFASNPKLNTAEAITQLGVGEALISFLADGGIPTPVERAYILAPSSRIGAITEQERQACLQQSPVSGKYEQAINRESAAEILATRAQAPESAAPPPAPSSSGWSIGWPWGKSEPEPQAQPPQRPIIAAPRSVPKAAAPRAARASNRQGVGEVFAKTVVRTVGSSIGRQLIRGILGALIRR
jgi:uncharacterized protein